MLLIMSKYFREPLLTVILLPLLRFIADSLQEDHTCVAQVLQDNTSLIFTVMLVFVKTAFFYQPKGVFFLLIRAAADIKVRTYLFLNLS
jgi:hypothetical protein